MPFRTTSVIATTVICIAFLPKQGIAQERQITKKDVPSTVREAFQKSYPNATVKGYSKENDGEVTVYEIECMVKGVHHDITYTADGALVTIEQTMDLADAPEAVRRALLKVYPKGKVSLCERITKGETTQFEVLVTSDKLKYEVTLNPDGRIVETERK